MYSVQSISMCLKTLQNRLFDVVVIGGGITGLGVSLEFAKNGFDVVLVEKGELSTETSNNSLRIIHGGFRYLQTGNLFQIIDSIRDQARVIKESSTLVKSLPCIMPLKKYGLKSKFFVEPAAKFYNYFAEQLRGVGNKATVLDSAFVDRHISLLNGKAPYGALLWYDARVRDPLKLAALMAHRIDREGGDIVKRATALSVEKKDKFFEVQVESFNDEGMRFVTPLTSRIVVNATGFTKHPVSFLDKTKQPQSSIQWAAAYNVVLNKKIQERFAIGIQSKEGRLFFAVPRAEVTAIGTGYIPVDLITDAGITDNVVNNFIDEFSRSAQCEVNRSDIDFVEWGIIPVKSISQDGKKISFFGRSLIQDTSGYFEVTATKYTTFHSTGRRVLKRATKYLR